MTKKPTPDWSDGSCQETPQRPDLDAEIKRLKEWLAELSARLDKIEHRPNPTWRIK